MEIQLVMFTGDGARRAFPVSKQRMLVGRKLSCDLRIPLPCVSRHHCELTLDPHTGQVTLRDLGSSNGTYCNGQRVQVMELAAGDEIRIGPVVFTVVVDGQPEWMDPAGAALGSEETVNSAETRRAADNETLPAVGGEVSPAARREALVGHGR